MKKHIVIIRFGSPVPLQKELKFMCEELIAEEDREKAHPRAPDGQSGCLVRMLTTNGKGNPT